MPASTCPHSTSFTRGRERCPTGPSETRSFLEAKKLFVAYTPYKFVGHRIETAMFHPWVVGYRRHSFMRAMWKYVDIDNDAKAERGGMTPISRRALRLRRSLRPPFDAAVAGKRTELHGRTGRKSCGTRLKSQRLASIRSQSVDLYSRIVTRTSSMVFYCYDYLARPFKIKPCDRRGHARSFGRLSHLDGAHQTWHLLSGRPGVQRTAQRADRARTTCIPASDFSTRAGRRPHLPSLGSSSWSAWPSCATPR